MVGSNVFPRSNWSYAEFIPLTGHEDASEGIVAVAALPSIAYHCAICMFEASENKK